MVFIYMYKCTTVHTDTCGLTLGLHVCLRIVEIEIANYPSLIFYKIHYYNDDLFLFYIILLSLIHFGTLLFTYIIIYEIHKIKIIALKRM